MLIKYDVNQFLLASLHLATLKTLRIPYPHDSGQRIPFTHSISLFIINYYLK